MCQSSPKSYALSKRCLCCSFAHIDDLDSYLALDLAYGIESAAIIWGM